MYNLIYSSKIKKDIKLCKRRNYDFEEFKIVIGTLESTGELPITYKPHKLSGNYSGRWECHIKPDWLLIWKQNEKKFIWSVQEHIVIYFRANLCRMTSVSTQPLIFFC